MATVTSACVDEEIDARSLSLSDLHAQNDSFSPVFRLPPEILESIFILGARDYHENTRHPDFRVPDWLNISYVCRHWRNVALGYSTLWSYHFTVSLRWTEELLARSKQESLKIRIYCDHARARFWWSDLVEKLLSHVERIQELILRIPATILPSNLSLSAPRLQILDICGIWSHPSEWTLAINEGAIPALHSLKLTHCPLRWHSLNLGGVTTLFLRNVPSPVQQDIMEFVAALSRMQALTFLYLEHALVSAGGFLSSAEFEMSPKFDLPCLTRLYVRAPLSTVIALLSRINIPLKTDVRIGFGSENGTSANDYAQTSSVLSQKFSHSKDLLPVRPSIRSLLIRSDLASTSCCASEEEDCDPGNLWMVHPQWEANLPLVIVMESLESDINSDHIICEVCCSMPLTHVQTLHFVNPPFSPDFWKKILGHLHGLRRLKLSDGYMPDLISALSLAADEPAHTSGGRIASDRNPTAGYLYVPALEVLELYCIIFAPNEYPGDDIPMQTFLDAVSTRKALRLTMIRSGPEDEPSDAEDEYDTSDYLDVDELY